MSKSFENTLPVFRLKPVPFSNSCTVKHVGYVNKNEKLGDERVEFETTEESQKKVGKNIDYLGVINNYDISVYIFKNNIIGSYLLKNDFVPIYSLSIFYKNNIVSGPLFDIFLGFKLDDYGKKLAKTPAKLKDAYVSGTYQIKILCEDSVKNNMNEFYNNIGSELLNDNEFLEKIESIEETEAEKYTDELIDINRTFIEELVNGKNIEKFETHTKMIENILRPIYSNNKLNLFIRFCLEKREEDRRQKLNAPKNYNLPKRVLNIKDVEKDENYLKTYLNLE